MVAYHAIRRSGLRLHDRVLVVGGGIIGQLCGELAKKAGASFVALSKVSEAKTQHARRLGLFDAYFDGNDPGGAVVLIGNALAPEVPFALNQAVLNEISLIGSVSCTRVEFEETIDLIAKGMIDPTRYVTEVLPLEGLQRAFERQCDPDDPALKFVVKP